MATEHTWNFVNKQWDETVIPTISAYIEIPNVSPMFDPQWASNGLIEKAAQLLHEWALKQNVKGLTSEILHLPGKTPLIFLTVPPSHPDIVDSPILMYGHLDKQPPMTETWAEGLHPYKPVIKDGKLYGRGGADDGYAIFAAVLSLKALQEQNLPHGRIVILIEASEESGSIHLMDYIEHLKEKIGVPSLVVCLDSGSGNYEQFWTTTTLRGVLSANLTVKILKEGVHSGHASGIVPSSFRILRQLLDRIEDPSTGEIKLPELSVEIPAKRLQEIKSCAQSLGHHVIKEFPWVPGAHPVTEDIETCIINRTWRPTLSITGVDGIPAITVAGNVLRPHTSVKLSIRLPPSLNPKVAGEALHKVLTANPPYGAQIECHVEKFSPGFDAPPFAEWLDTSMSKASNYFYKKPANYVGEGGSIPFMGLLKEKFPQAQFVITGILGPESNAHGPNEFLHIDFAKRVTACVTSILADHGVQFSKNKK